MLEKNLLSVEELVDYLGGRYTTRYIYSMCQKRIIPHFKPNGRAIFFKRDEVDEWITQGRVKPLSELNKEL